MYATHMGFGLLAGIILAPFLGINTLADKIIFIALTTFASLLPDIDHEGSKINQFFPITRRFARLFKHRGFFHSIFPALIIYILFDWLGFSLVAKGIAIGYLAHLASDCLTFMGVGLLHPIAHFKIEGPLKTGGLMEAALRVLVYALCLWQGYLLFF